MPHIAFIIVNLNTADLLMGCLRSIEETSAGMSYETWVVDNGSSDGSVQAVREGFPRARVIENRENLGFARANNQALKEMSGEYAVLLNTDTVLTKGAVRNIIRFMEETPDAGICGGQLLNQDGSRQNSIANIPSLATELLNKSLLRRLFPSRYLGKEHRFDGPVEVESVIGACMVVRRKAMDEVGHLGEEYFFFLEETDWCLRFRQKGWKVFHHPAAEIYHLQGSSAGRAPVRARVEYWRSRYIFFRQNRGAAARILLSAGLMGRLLVSFALAAFLNLATFFASSRLRGKLRVYASLLLWHMAGCPVSWGLRGSS